MPASPAAAPQQAIPLELLKKPDLLAAVAAAPVTALQLPTIALPVPEKPELSLPAAAPAVPVYQFQLPDVKAELAALGDQIKNQLGFGSQVQPAFPAADAFLMFPFPSACTNSSCPWSRLSWRPWVTDHEPARFRIPGTGRNSSAQVFLLLPFPSVCTISSCPTPRASCSPWLIGNELGLGANLASAPRQAHAFFLEQRILGVEECFTILLHASPSC